MQRFSFIGLALSALFMLGCADPADDVDPVDVETGVVDDAPVEDIDDDGIEPEVDPELGAEEGVANEPPADPAVDEEPATELPETPAEP